MNVTQNNGGPDGLRKFIAAVATLAMLFAGATFSLTLFDDDQDGKTDGATITLRTKPVKVPGAKPITPDAGNERSVQEQAKGENAEQAPAAIGPAGHEDLRDEAPPGVPLPQVQNGLGQTNAPGATAPVPVGGAQNYSCRNTPVGNKSSRNGQKPLLAVLHYTVSRNRPGWSDVMGIVGLFNRRSFGASSTYVIDFEGNCAKLMPESSKPWTQGNFNGRSISVEIIAYGNETRRDWLNSNLIRRGVLSSLWRDVLRRNGLPLARVNPVGCGVQRAGWTDHNALECGNDHHDVTPNFPYDEFQRQLTRGSTVSSVDRVTCRKLTWWRENGRPSGAAEANAVRRRRALDSRGVTCTSKGAVKR